MLVCLNILLLTIKSNVVIGLTQYDTDACYDINAGKYYCCSNFEEINNKCIECKIGLKSRNGESCKLCSLNFFGIGCSKECNCNHLQRCDNVKGCLDKENTVGSKSNTANENVTMAHTEGQNHGTGISKTELLMLYSVASSGIFVLLGIFGILYYLKRRIGRSKSKPVDTTVEEVQRPDGHVNQETFELHERFYEEIDESLMENILHPRIVSPKLAKDDNASKSRSNLNTKNKSFNRNIGSSEKADSFVKISTKNVVDQKLCSFGPAAEDSSSSSDSTVDRTSYLHPYNTLSSKKSYCHTYEGAVQSTTI